MRSEIEEPNLPYRAGVFLIVLVLGMLFYGFTVWAWNSPAELGAYDMLMRMKLTRPPRADMVILAIDQRTTAELGGLPWSRATHARIVRALQEAGADYIVYDFHFPGPDTANPGADRAFWQAMLAERNVFLPMTYDPLIDAEWDPSEMRGLFRLEDHALTGRVVYTPDTPLFRYYYFVPPWADFVGAAAGVGVEVNQDGQDVNSGRQVRMVYLTRVTYPVPSRPLARDTTLPELTNQIVVLQSLPLAVARSVFEIDDQLTQTTFGGRITFLADLSPFVDIPVDEAGMMNVDFLGQAGSFPHYSAVDLLEGRLDSDVFSNRMVFVGVTDPNSAEASFLRTPFGTMPRVEVTMNVVASILNRDYIARDQRHALAALIVLAVLLGLALPFLSRWELGPMALALSLVYIVIAVIILTAFRVALPVIPAVILILTAAVTAALLKPVMFIPDTEPAVHPS